MRISPLRSLIVLLLLVSFNLHAQQPNLKVAGKDSASVLLTKLKTEVKVIGNYAVTTMEMEFCNNTDRVLEGELIFPMPDGVSISRYAIDINGKMREAVPVEKEKGQVVFENIVRRNVDPGLLEKVEGNNFRTRIYPIPANGCRTVLIGYEQLLSLNSKYAFVYSLPLHFKEPIKQFDFSITVASNYIPEVGSDCNTNLKFEELNKVFTSSVSKKDFTPDGAFTIAVPKTADAAEISMQSMNDGYYFLINTFPIVKKIEKKIPDVITVIWDASLSGMNRDHKKELDLLDAYIKTKRNLTINLYEVAVDFKKINTYAISNANWSEMRKVLEDITYDGATNFSTINYLPPGDEFLFFTDGLNSFGNIDNMMLPQKPVYTICAAPVADYSLLKFMAAKTGGSFINLNELEITAAQKYLAEQTVQFIGIKPNSNITDIFPSVPTPIVGNCTIAGISHSSQSTVTLQFGYGSTVTFEQNIDMNFYTHNTNFINIKKIWAQKKIAELDIQYQKNKDEITELGKKYSIITRNTSLIVLDAVEDYVQYEIEPPAELMAAYTKLMNEKKMNIVTNKKESLTEVLKYLKDLESWWNKEFKVVLKVQPPPKTLRPDEVVTSAVPLLRDRTPLNSENVNSAGMISNVSADSIRMRMVSSNRSPLQDTDGDGVNDDVDKCINDRGPASNFGCPVISEDNLAARATAPIYDSLGNNVRFSQGLFTANDGVNDEVDRVSYNWSYDAFDRESINVKEPAPDKAYLKELRMVAKEGRYKRYLELRKENNLPPFYFNVANLFFTDGDTATGYKILTNIADLNLDDHELYKMLGYRLKTIKRYDDEVMVFKKVLQWRPQDPQSYRDYALALADAGRYQQALDTLYLALTKIYDEEIKNLYPGIEEIIVTEINNLIAQHGAGLNTSGIDKNLIKKLPVDVRVVLNWNMNDTDIDLWVIDPNGEICYYQHKLTAIGGRISNDFTRGYGPEHFMLKKALKGNYKVMIKYYGDRQQKIAGPTTVMAEIFTNYGSPSQERKMITLQMQKKENAEVLVGEFSF